MVVMGTRPMNTKIMWRRVVDQPLFHLANDRQSIVICGIFVDGTDLPFSNTSISTLCLLQSMANIIAALQLFALALMGCGVSFKVLLDLALIFAGWTFGNFCISLFERRGVRAHRPGRSLAVGLLILACAIRRALGKV